MNNFNRAIFPFVIAVALVGQGCASHSDSSKEENTHTASASVDAVNPAKGNLTSSLTMPGELVAYQQVDLYAKISSFIKKLYVDAGSEVRAGQLLAVLEAPEINSQLAAAQSRLNSQDAVYLASKATYERLLQTSKTPGTVSQNDLDLSYSRQRSDHAQLEAARAAYREVTNTRAYLEIRAPFNGIITARNVSAGAYVGPTGKGSDQPIFTLQEQKKLRLVVSVPDAYAGSMDNKSTVSFTVKSMPNHPFTARVSRMAGALDNKLRSQRVEMDVENNSKALLPGMIAEVSIPLKGNVNAHVVPTTAVLNSTEGVFVIRVADSKAEWVPVKIGSSDTSRTEVFGPLSDADVIIVKANEEFRNGQVVNNIKMK
jgi:RND family efflux transporter MFP subunit